MDSEAFPEFEQTGFYRSWVKAQIAFPDQTDEQRRETLRMALSLYRHCKEEHQADQHRDDRGVGLPG